MRVDSQAVVWTAGLYALALPSQRPYQTVSDHKRRERPPGLHAEALGPVANWETHTYSAQIL